MRVAKEDDSCGHQSHIHLQWRLGWFWECMKLYSMNSGVSKISTVMFLNSYKWDYKSYNWGYISLYILPFITVKGHNCILLSVCTCYVFLTNGRSDAEKTFFFTVRKRPSPSWVFHKILEALKFETLSLLVGGLEHFLFFHILGIVLPFD